MSVGICEIDIFIYGSDSLKERRNVVRKIIDKVRNRFNVSIAEVGDSDLWQRTALKIACVNSDRQEANTTLSKVINMIEEEVEVRIVKMEII
jgi:uncharacterized protein YlxP (DUF503 family)